MAEFAMLEGTLRARDGTRLFVRSTSLDQDAKAIVILTHGIGEHSARYLHVAEFLATQGYRFCAYDLRGHGRSDGRRGALRSYDDFLDDLEEVLAYFRQKNVPTFLYGVSLGGQIVINFVLKRQCDIAGMIISSPWLRLAFKPSLIKTLLARAALAVWPDFTQLKPANLLHLSHDIDFLNSMRDLDLVHHRVSARMYAQLTRAAVCAMAQAEECVTPLFLIHGDEDPITSHAGSREFFQRAKSPDKTFLLLPGHRHEVHNETKRAEVLAQIAAWLTRGLPDSFAQASKTSR
ncbi:MAG: lysophospholipase [Verrucomicrobiota bacterium]